MRWVGEALRGARTALAAHPVVFASVTLAVATLNVVAPVAILSAVRKPLDFYTFNPWLKRLPEYVTSYGAPRCSGCTSPSGAAIAISPSAARRGHCTAEVWRVPRPRYS